MAGPEISERHCHPMGVLQLQPVSGTGEEEALDTGKPLQQQLGLPEPCPD
ncbi:MAG TPA: hypothetical protein PLK36_06535 [Methanoregulaceae archaeon]|nr:hypothetical protein [Methanoregulaceae archaeon]